MSQITPACTQALTWAFLWGQRTTQRNLYFSFTFNGRGSRSSQRCAALQWQAAVLQHWRRGVCGVWRFSSLITALNVAYDVKEGRPYWKKRLVALGPTLLTGIMPTVVLSAVALVPQVGSWIAENLNVSDAFLRT